MIFSFCVADPSAAQAHWKAAVRMCVVSGLCNKHNLRLVTFGLATCPGGSWVAMRLSFVGYPDERPATARVALSRNRRDERYRWGACNHSLHPGGMSLASQHPNLQTQEP
jgi:hypothetical protein